jgi:glycosyltransferase involved in cell wall biosynthesis
MVGDGPLRTEVDDKISSFSIQNYITCVGYKKDVRPWIAMSDVLLLTSDTEGMPGVVLEAAAMKKVTISTDVGGVREFVKHQENGYIITNKSLQEFVEYIVFVNANKELNIEMSITCFENVLDNYSLLKIKKSYLDFLKIKFKQF